MYSDRAEENENRPRPLSEADRAMSDWKLNQERTFRVHARQDARPGVEERDDIEYDANRRNNETNDNENHENRRQPVQSGRHGRGRYHNNHNRRRHWRNNLVRHNEQTAICNQFMSFDVDGDFGAKDEEIIDALVVAEMTLRPIRKYLELDIGCTDALRLLRLLDPGANIPLNYKMANAPITCRTPLEFGSYRFAWTDEGRTYTLGFLHILPVKALEFWDEHREKGCKWVYNKRHFACLSCGLPLQPERTTEEEPPADTKVAPISSFGKASLCFKYPMIKRPQDGEDEIGEVEEGYLIKLQRTHHDVEKINLSASATIAILKQHSIISGEVYNTEDTEVYIAKQAQCGLFAVGDQMNVHIVHHEPEHTRHWGVCAGGYDHFICGKRNSSDVWRTLYKGAVKDVSFVVSRSWSYDCDDFNSRIRQGDLRNRLHDDENDEDEIKVECLPTENVLEERSIRAYMDFAYPHKTTELLRLKFEVTPNIQESCEFKDERVPSIKEIFTSMSGVGVIITDEEDFTSVKISLSERLCDECSLCRILKSETQTKAMRVRGNGRRNTKRDEDLGKKEEIDIRKYQSQKYRLLSRFDDGVRLDNESWFSICPEEIAKHIARRVCRLYKGKPLVVLDGFCGAGGNIIQLARMNQIGKVIAADIDEEKIQMARHNAALYGVEGKIEFIHCSFPELQIDQEIDAIVFSPPWGGPQYLDKPFYDMTAVTPAYGDIMNKCTSFTKNIAVLLPRNTVLDKVLHNDLAVDFEQNFLGGRMKTVTVYYGDLAKGEPRNIH